MVSVEEFKNDFKPPKQEIKKQIKLTREEVETLLEQGEHLENLVLTDLDLAGLNFEGKRFCKSDIRGLSLYQAEEKEDKTVVETITNIRNCDFTDATIADYGPGTFFNQVEAEGALFGYTEDLISRRKNHEKSGKAPQAKDTGGLFNFYGCDGKFKKTRWTNADFGGGSGYEALFTNADLSESTIEGCDLSEIDFSETNIDNLKIINPVSLSKMRINEDQIETVAQAIQFTDLEKQAEFLKEIESKGSQKALEDYFKIVICK